MRRYACLVNQASTSTTRGVMDASQFGPFANVVAIGSAIVAVFSVFVLKMVGRVNRWTWLIEDTPPFLVKAGPRAVAVAVMGAAYVLIDPSNYGWFLGLGILSGLLAFRSVKSFDKLRRRHVLEVPLVADSGEPVTNRQGKTLHRKIVIGLRESMNETAARHFEEAQKKHGVSMVEFMSGYGSGQLYDPGALWERDHLADIAHKLAAELIYIITFGFVTLFLVALAIDIAA